MSASIQTESSIASTEPCIEESEVESQVQAEPARDVAHLVIAWVAGLTLGYMGSYVDWNRVVQVGMSFFRGN
jgi:hypothetical protein